MRPNVLLTILTVGILAVSCGTKTTADFKNEYDGKTIGGLTFEVAEKGYQNMLTYWPWATFTSEEATYKKISNNDTVAVSTSGAINLYYGSDPYKIEKLENPFYEFKSVPLYKDRVDSYDCVLIGEQCDTLTFRITDENNFNFTINRNTSDEFHKMLTENKKISLVAKGKEKNYWDGRTNVTCIYEMTFVVPENLEKVLQIMREWHALYFKEYNAIRKEVGVVK